mmetsp:Transcript_34295/g.61571  ORF Transcript_34295/g.61571 Transcript_34295/m.61571 type:complete len:102 (+) Transcript_34295:1556-1861(+)|eukprot:CAMPEP_0201947942 /NCGR_PEP_ID=MMETSP0903-20130614/55203_1 /ASSEMBLY_ACC=CAM_ASM_000552 /TAXON_ID=420261 /ORGANISM="Thalassiosira antarctica, Strain CCMP982" /LENGTH=101 /DNA_ID=CAMNT_0048491103 /DNA_START=2288 /DNA_END=2593 /DNA_ORIENTATION=-
MIRQRYPKSLTFTLCRSGNRPWDNNERGNHSKAAIQKGERPQVDDVIRSTEGAVDAELAWLLDTVCEGDQLQRASAKDVVDELGRLLERELEKNPPLSGKG